MKELRAECLEEALCLQNRDILNMDDSEEKPDREVSKDIETVTFYNNVSLRSSSSESGLINSNTDSQESLTNHECELTTEKTIEDTFYKPILCRHGVSDAERKADLENALGWLRKELQDMKTQDRVLAKQLIGLRAKIQHMVKNAMFEDMGYDSDEDSDQDSLDSGISAGGT